MRLVSLFLYIILAFFIKDRSEFWLYFVVYTGIFLTYLLEFKKSNKQPIWPWAIAFRLVFLISIPYLSDDFYRFIWDGTLINQGINPYLHLPSEIENAVRQYSIYPLLNSQNYYSVYPPFNQVLFATATFLSPKTLLGQIIGIRIVLWVFEIGTCFLLHNFSKRLNRPQLTIIYALNPLVIMETTGNLHFEVVIVFFCLLAFYLFSKHFLLSALALGSAISVKLIPILFLPIIFFNLTVKKSISYITISIAVLMLSFLPFWNTEVMSNFTQSIDLFFRNFEFNASIYYIFRQFGFWIYGYNMIQFIGVGLKLFAGLFILYIAFNSKNFGVGIVLTLFIYLSTATTVHPWYVIPLLAASLFTDLKFAILWSYLVVLSYHAYGPNGFEENELLLFLEYLPLVAFCIYEYKLGRFKLDSLQVSEG